MPKIFILFEQPNLSRGIFVTCLWMKIQRALFPPHYGCNSYIVIEQRTSNSDGWLNQQPKGYHHSTCMLSGRLGIPSAPLITIYYRKYQATRESPTRPDQQGRHILANLKQFNQDQLFAEGARTHVPAIWEMVNRSPFTRVQTTEFTSQI